MIVNVVDIIAEIEFDFCFYVFGFVTDEKWQKLHLTYRFLNFTPDLPQSTVRAVFQQAFQVNECILYISFQATLQVLSTKRNNRSSLSANK